MRTLIQSATVNYLLCMILLCSVIKHKDFPLCYNLFFSALLYLSSQASAYFPKVDVCKEKQLTTAFCFLLFM